MVCETGMYQISVVMTVLLIQPGDQFLEQNG